MGGCLALGTSVLKVKCILTSAGSQMGVQTFHCQHNFGFNSVSFTSNISHSELLVYAMLFLFSCDNGYAEVGI